MMQRDPVVTDVKLELSTPGIAVALATPLATVIARAKKLFEGCDCGDSQLSLTFGAVRFVRGTGAASNAGFVRGRVEDAVSRAVQQILRPMNRQIGGARADSPDPFLRLLHWLTRIVDVPCGPLRALCVRRAIREPVTCTWLISGNIDGQPFTITVKIELIVMAHIFYYHNLQSLQRLPQYVILPDPKRNSVPSPHSPTPECWDCERPLVLIQA